MTVLLVAADDRTGALEVAGACADAGLPATVLAGAAPHTSARGCLVVDLGSRHSDPGDAAERAAAMERWPARRVAHKIDSTLRGSWAHELVARARVAGRRVLVVPAFPAAGRVCSDGVVLVHGRPVAGVHADARAPVRSSRPADHLREAGASAVDALDGPAAVPDWLRAGRAFAVCDAASEADLARIAASWQETPQVLLAGTASAIGHAAAALGSRNRPGPRPRVSGPALVVCGSLHPAARAQVQALLAAGAVAASGAAAALAALASGHHAVLTSPVPAALPVPAAEAAAAAAALAEVAEEVLASGLAHTLVLVGGDTAAAVLGHEPVEVFGTLAPGVAVCRAASGPVVVAKPGGFGEAGLLVDLLSARMEP